MIVPIMANTNPHQRPDGTTANFRLRGSGGKIWGKLRKLGVHIIYMTPLRITPNPMVTIITEITGSPISGLKIRRSTMIPRTTAEARVRIKAR
ncbi:hypothetical protein ES703_123491 [subsurface metagenome]